MRIIEGLASVAAALDALGARRVLVLTTPGRRFLQRLMLGEREVEVFDQARVHVPLGTVDEAERRLEAFGADTILALGGGAATGLGKALRLRRDVRFLAIPTTFSGSELTRIWGTTADGKKQTGRDERVRPDVVVYAAELFDSLPRRIAVTSLLNAFAHPLSALTAGPLESGLEAQSLQALRHLSRALDEQLEAPGSQAGLGEALKGVQLGAGVLDQAAMGPHHRVAHLLGGALGLEHSGLHAVLLPHSVRKWFADSPEQRDLLAEATGSADLPGHLYDALQRSGASRSLIALGATPSALATLAAENPDLNGAWVQDAMVGRRPSLLDRRLKLGDQPDVTLLGADLATADRVVVAIHGRGSDAGSIARMAADLVAWDPNIAIVAPQAPTGAWYPASYRATRAEHGETVPNAIAAVDAVLAYVLAASQPERTWLFGFSQGACLASEVFARTTHALAGLVALAGARIGPREEQLAIRRNLTGTVVLLGAATEDKWVTVADVEALGDACAARGARVVRTSAPGDVHAITSLQRLAARELLLGRPRTTQSGFGNHLASEALPGALPLHQNNPRSIAYGLYGEHMSGTGFTAPRADNRKLWLYRIRPAATHAPFRPLPHATLTAAFTGEVDANLAAFRALAVPSTAADLIDGLVTLGGAGDPSLRRGYAVHLYAANRSMDDRAFANADGDLLIVPFEGRLTLLTEAGALDVAPGHVAVVPRGLRFSALLADGTARGWIAEVFGRSFVVPERGAVGANGLADERHFRAPNAWFENRLSPGYRIVHKLGGALHEATQDHSPYDVVAWNGNSLPFVYDLADFSPVGNARVDHIDPSAHCVLHAALDEPGVSCLDLVAFVPRWDPTEHSFRPPYFHRNAVTEINGIISDPSLPPGSPFSVGMTFLTPCLTPHGVRAPGVERAFVADDSPARVPDGSLWFQFESALPFHFSAWAKQARERIPEWPSVWGAYRAHFVPPGSFPFGPK